MGPETGNSGNKNGPVSNLLLETHFMGLENCRFRPAQFIISGERGGVQEKGGAISRPTVAAGTKTELFEAERLFLVTSRVTSSLVEPAKKQK